MWGGAEERDAVRTVRTALDLEIHVIDTAPVYGLGKSEELMGQAIAEHGGREAGADRNQVGLEWRAGLVFRLRRPTSEKTA